MTAKEMYNKANSYPIVMAGADVVFSKKEFEQFISQLCKEQRKECAKIFDPSKYGDIIAELILTTKQPNIFEES